MEVLHDLRAGKVRALNEKPHQHLRRSEISACQCHSQLLLAHFSFLYQSHKGKLNWREELFLKSVSNPTPHSSTSSSYLTELFHKVSQYVKKSFHWGKDAVVLQCVLALVRAFSDSYTVFNLHTDCRGPYNGQTKDHQPHDCKFRVTSISLESSCVFLLQRKRNAVLQLF